MGTDCSHRRENTVNLSPIVRPTLHLKHVEEGTVCTYISTWALKRVIRRTVVLHIHSPSDSGLCPLPSALRTRQYLVFGCEKQSWQPPNASESRCPPMALSDRLPLVPPSTLISPSPVGTPLSCLTCHVLRTCIKIAAATSWTKSLGMAVVKYWITLLLIILI
jgi:hypothetical protein